MAKYCTLLALLFIGGFALPTVKDDVVYLDDDMSIYFDHTITAANGRIVGGNVAAEGAYPWMVALTHGIIENFQCGGSIITSKHVLTAAHCIVTIPPFNILSPFHRVRVGTNVWNTGGQVRSIQSFRRHEKYDCFYMRNDIGIIITTERIKMNSRVAAIPLNSRFIPTNVAVRVSGFGRLEAGGPISERLMEIRKTTVESSRCIKEIAKKSEQMDQIIPAMDPATQICAFKAINQAVCNGDSGSPLVIDVNQQVGIVSWGMPCALGVPDVFVRVSAYIDWIIANTA